MKCVPNRVHTSFYYVTLKFAVLPHFVYVCTYKTNIATRYEF